MSHVPPTLPSPPLAAAAPPALPMAAAAPPAAWPAPATPQGALNWLLPPCLLAPLRAWRGPPGAPGRPAPPQPPPAVAHLYGGLRGPERAMARELRERLLVELVAPQPQAVTVTFRPTWLQQATVGTRPQQLPLASVVTFVDAPARPGFHRLDRAWLAVRAELLAGGATRVTATADVTSTTRNDFQVMHLTLGADADAEARRRLLATRPPV